MPSHRIISADDHMDLHVLPPRLFEERLPREWRDRAPRVERRDGARVWVVDGKAVGSSGSQKGTGIVWAFEKAGLEDDGYRPADPDLRLHDMDLDGVHAQVIYGPPLGLPVRDPGLKDACARVYNDWAAEFNAAAPQRLCLLAYLPTHSPEAAAAEAQRIAKLGHRGAVLGLFESGVPVFDPAWEPLWSIVGEARLPLSFHFGGGTSLIRSKPGSWMMPAYVSALPLQLDEGLAAMIFCGALERHPGMRLVVAECGIGWLPYFLWRMDLMFDTYNHQTRDYALRARPSEIFREQVFVTFQEDPVGAPMIPQIGSDNVMWASDYPHPNSTFPESKRAVDELIAVTGAEVGRKVTCDNAARLYRFTDALDS
jgi:predicted TIM-barrel fold metal-dependent hydrolase